jgi:hypothetical protein
MKVTIEKDPQGQFFVSTESAAPAMPAGEGMPSEGMAQAPAENKQPAQDLQEALMLAGKLLSTPDKAAGPSPFDEGMQETMPRKMPMGGM